jgi:hypothetical protein
MSFGPLTGGGGGQRGLPTPPRGEPIARYDTYLDAQRAVDFLSDHRFPVENVTIVGTDLRMVERVTGRLSYGRVSVAGALSGAWFGLFVGLLLSLFGGGPAFSMLAAVIIGAGFGILFGVISYAATGGRRDFTSTSQIVASEYQVLCMAEHANAALELLSHLPGGTGRPARPTEPPPPAAPSAEPEPPSVPVSGPTYGEMIDRQRRAEREAERERTERERLDREQREQHPEQQGHGAPPSPAP